MTSKLATTCCAIGFLVGVGATWLVLRSSDAPAAARPAAVQRDRAADRPSAVVIAARAAPTDDTRRLVREEIRAALREHGMPPALAEAPTAKAEAEAESVAATPAPTPAFDRATDHLAQRISQGTWTVADRDRMRGALGAVNHAERLALIRQVVIAANTGKLQVATVGPLF